MSKIRALVMDVDGTLTNGNIYIGNECEVMKCFYVRDGYAIKHFLPKMGITPIIVTGRKSRIIETRCRELQIEHIVQGSEEKWTDLQALLLSLGILPEEVAYIGDDVNDLNCMKHVGLCGCPSDAVKAIKEVADYVAISRGGCGAVREFIEWLSGDKHEEDINSKWDNK